MTKFLAVLAALCLALAAPVYAQSSTQVLNYNEVQTEINAGALIQTGSGCSFTGDTATTHNVFVSCISNNGSCAGASNILMTWGAMQACRTLTSVITAVTDPWFINSGTYWSNYSGATPNFSTTPASGAPSAPSGAQNPLSSNTANEAVSQEIMPATINASTHIVVRAYAYSQTGTIITNTDCSGSTNTTHTAVGQAQLSIISSGGTVEATSTLSNGSNSWSQLTASWTATATGTYYIVLTDVPQSISGTFHSNDIHSTCVSAAVSAEAHGFLTGVSAGNS